MKKKETASTTGSGDIFVDFGFAEEEAAGLAIKAALYRTLQKVLKETGRTQKELSEMLGVPQPKISDILNGKMSGLSVERLANYLLELGYNICVDAQPAPAGERGRVIQKNLLSA